jgi:putative transposase
MVDRRLYDTDLSDAEWDRLQPLVPSPKPLRSSRQARSPRNPERDFYVVRSGAAWKLLPHDLPPWRTVYHYFWSWRRQGIWQQIHDTLREGVRQAARRKPEPSGAILDSQSVRTTEQGGARGYDAAKQVCGESEAIIYSIFESIIEVCAAATRSSYAASPFSARASDTP